MTPACRSSSGERAVGSVVAIVALIWRPAERLSDLHYLPSTGPRVSGYIVVKRHAAYLKRIEHLVRRVVDLALDALLVAHESTFGRSGALRGSKRSSGAFGGRGPRRGRSSGSS